MLAKMPRRAHEYFMREALLEAEKALAAGNWPIGAVVVLGDEIIARSGNQVYTDSDKTHHAEILALQQAAHILHEQRQRATLYSTYEPCPMCLGAALVNHVGIIVCGPDLDGSGALLLLERLPVRFMEDKYRPIVIADVLEKECVELALRGIPAHRLLPEKAEAYRKLYDLP